MTNKHKVFFSFSEDDCGLFRQALGELSSLGFDFDFFDGPFAGTEACPASRIKRLIGEKLVACTVTVCLISENTHKSAWVDCQLLKSRQKGNRIIAMAFKGTKDAVLPEIIRQENLRFYPWEPAKLAKLLFA